MLYPRLKLSRSLLTDDGVIFISIDDNEVENLKKVINEIFGEENFIGDLIRKTKSSTNDVKTGLNIQHENTLIYGKNKSNVLLKGRPKDLSKYKNPDNDPNGPWTSSDPSVPRSGHDFEIKNPHTGKIDTPPVGRAWNFSKEKFEDMVKSGKVKFKKNHSNSERGFIVKRYVNELKDVFNKVNSLEFTDNHFMNQTATKNIISLFDFKIFDYTKPVEFVKKLIMYATNENDFIIDFFSGSSVTAEACMLLNQHFKSKRKFIMVQLPEPTDEKSEAFKAGYETITEVGKERIRRAGDKIKSESNNENLDIGFKVFKLDSSNLKKWDPDYEDPKQTVLTSVDNIKEDRTEFDLLYEIMLKYGINLTLPIEEYTVNNKKIYSVGIGALLICLDNEISSEIAIEIIKLKKDLEPETTRVVFKDNGFLSDSDKTNIRETLKNNNIDEFITI
jgi:adenine-specific DNA-methyltransferase